MARYLPLSALYHRQKGKQNSMTSGLTIVCPIRGVLKARSRSRDGLRPSEERVRVQAIRHFLSLGYPSENFVIEAITKRFGNSGRNSMRADFAILDIPARDINTSDADALMDHSLILAEIKRDETVGAAAKEYQVKPLLDFSRREDTVVVSWGEVEQRVYWNSWSKGKRTLVEGPLASAPRYGFTPGLSPLTLPDIDATVPLLGIFSRIEDVLHSSGIGPSRRFTIMLQLLLAKLFDEHQAQEDPSAPLEIQDFGALGATNSSALKRMDTLVARAARYYSPFLPEAIPSALQINGDTLLDVARILAPSRISAMNRSVIQEFYMYFARHIYKWDMAQYFTPTALTEFIVDLANPRPTEHVRDPACGSADFLTAAYRRGEEWPGYANNVWGSDVSKEAVQVAVLNMILNGDGRTNITAEDSLENLAAHVERYDVVVCNPPFGAKITDRRHQILSKYALGHEWEVRTNSLEPTPRVLDSQETGILFVEACVRMLRAGGRLAIILPNGYLGNRSSRYHALREWLLRECRIAAIVALPRFTFKASGADVSASIVFCERRREPLATSEADNDYEFSVEVIDRVGWATGDSKGTKLYRRDESDGTFLVDEDGNLMSDSDFNEVLSRVRNSDAGEYFPWLRTGVSNDLTLPGWSVDIGAITQDRFRTLDPKRYARKFTQTRADLMARPHMRLGSIVDVIPERTLLGGGLAKIEPSRRYRHVEIQDVGTGSYAWHDRRGWELPQRAKHFAAPGDIYIGGIRNSVRKWFLVDDSSTNLVVTNGMLRLRLKNDQSPDRLVDLVVGLSSEAYRVQMRGLARGADGLAEIAAEDILDVILPAITDEDARSVVKSYVERLQAGHTRIETLIDELRRGGMVTFPEPPPQPDHTALL